MKRPDDLTTSSLLQQVIDLRADQRIIRRELEIISVMLAALTGPSEFDQAVKKTIGKNAPLAP